MFDNQSLLQNDWYFAAVKEIMMNQQNPNDVKVQKIIYKN